MFNKCLSEISKNNPIRTISDICFKKREFEPNSDSRELKKNKDLIFLGEKFK